MATNRRRLREVAIDQHGYVTTRDAGSLDIPPIELRKLAHYGGLSNISRGLYRFDDMPTTKHDHFQEAVLWVGKDDAHLAGTAVLALHELAQVNPTALQVNTTHRVRRQRRADIVVTHHAYPAEAETTYFGIHCMNVAHSLLVARSSVMTNRLQDATQQARTEGLITAVDFDFLMHELDHSA